MTKIPVYSIYLIYTGVLALLLLSVVSKKEIRNLAIYGIIFGAVADIIIILIVKALGVGAYRNYGPLGFLDIPFMPPIAWTIYFMIYFYLLPSKYPWNYFFAFIGGCYSVFFSNILANFGIFSWTLSKVILPFIVYQLWHFFATWSYLKIINNNDHFFNNIYQSEEHRK
ncbi:MAG: hypothetical protein ACOX4L_08655 [Bacillota bacterium]|jgi:hypothetical protein